MSSKEVKTIRKVKKQVWIAGVVLLAVVAIACGIAFNNQPNPGRKFNNVDRVVQLVGETQKQYLNSKELERENLFAEYKAINDDFVGVIEIGNLISERVVQSSDNEKYLKKDFEGNYDGKGTVFLDYRNSIEDQNLILYGHYVYYDETSMFTPLHELKDETNYEENKIVTFELMGEVRKYEIAYVYYYEMGNADLEYFHVKYSDYFDDYISNIQKVSFYDTGVEITKEDHFITLQTCVRDHDELRLIVVAKQIVD